jgi:hypothetical protein
MKPGKDFSIRKAGTQEGVLNLKARNPGGGTYLSIRKEGRNR